MGGEAAAMLNVGLLESSNDVLGPVDYGKHVQLIIAALKRVIRLVTCILQYDEGFGEVLDFGWESLHRLLVPTGIPGLSMLQGAIHLMPRRAAAPADEQVGRGAGQAVEHGVSTRC